MMSLRHTGGAVEATAIVDIPGVFTSKDGVVSAGSTASTF